ncbi:MAG: LemA family protein [bacterium]|nr:LemA family protein [bacterium]
MTVINQKKSNRNLWLAGGAVLLILIWFFSARNNLISMEEAVNASWAQVENQLQRRYDLVPNLVNTVKGYAKHEKEVFENIAEARSKIAGAGSTSEKIKAANAMESAISRLLMVVENYPALKSNEHFTRLMDELAGSENRISVERRRYNEHVKIFNKSIRMFPGSFVANMSGFTKKDYFQIDQKAKTAPKVEF